MNTNNTIRDKQIASYELERLYLNYYCGNNSYIKQKGINVCNLFLRNKYIEDSMKKKINLFLNKTNMDRKKINYGHKK